MSVKYDPEIIETAALALYEEARTIVRNTMIKYGFVFFFIGIITSAYFLGRNDSVGTLSFVIGLVFSAVGASLGKSAAASKAFILKLQAQTALCQVEIEKNSRD